MGRKTGCSKDGLNKGAWKPVEDKMLVDYLKIRGEGKWSNIARETASDLKNQSTIESQCTTGVVAATTTSQENSAQDHQHSIAMPQFTTSNLQHESSSKGPQNGAASNFKNQSTIESQCTTEVIAATSILQESTAQVHQDSIAIAQSADSNLHYDLPKTYEFESSSKGLASGGEDNSSNIMMFYDNMDDFSKILDSDFAEFTDIHDIFSSDHHSNNTDAVNGDQHGVSSNGCKSRETTEFPEKLLESDNWSSNKCVQADQGFDFMSLLSFLDSNEDEWTAAA
ncbi:hypothetical protein SADUNF_Sadunf18G0004100 [Salix dunnii]|uniref:Uncharacterized protein n=1 Tax=Salix dunnii TaxID=1413687 RepID=A0A835J578_9ROSI|nr:hypothetical protein SADUNF_Sadunf18G0004100 [Salix dunnii]